MVVQNIIMFYYTNRIQIKMYNKRKRLLVYKKRHIDFEERVIITKNVKTKHCIMCDLILVSLLYSI
jgi:RNase P subunit RPR2